MLSPFEQLLFILLALFSIGAFASGVMEVYAIITNGQGKLHFNGFILRAWNALRIYLSQETTLKTRKVSSLFHLGVSLGFTYYFLVNGVDTFLGFIPWLQETLNDFTGIPAGIYAAYRIIGDVFSVIVLVGVGLFHYSPYLSS